MEQIERELPTSSKALVVQCCNPFDEKFQKVKNILYFNVFSNEHFIHEWPDKENATPCS